MSVAEKPSTPSRVDNTEPQPLDPVVEPLTPLQETEQPSPEKTQVQDHAEQVENIDVLFPTLPKPPKHNRAKAILKTNPLNNPEISPRSPSKKKKIASKSPTKQISPSKTHSFVVPSFFSEEELQKRKQKRDEKILQDLAMSSSMAQYRVKQRKALKDDYELSREQSIAEYEVYKRHKQEEWKKKLSHSPFTVDLVAENERIEEVQNAKHLSEMKRKKEEERKLAELKKNLIVNALLDVPTAVDVHRNYKRLVSEDIKRMKALEEVKRTEIKQIQQQKKLQEIENERKKKIELRALSEML